MTMRWIVPVLTLIGACAGDPNQKAPVCEEAAYGNYPYTVDACTTVNPPEVTYGPCIVVHYLDEQMNTWEILPLKKFGCRPDYNKYYVCTSDAVSAAECPQGAWAFPK